MTDSTLGSAVEAQLLAGAVGQSATARRRSKFYVGLSGTLLLIVLIGFAPTLYLRAFFDVPDVPNSVLVHGVVLTAWFVGLFVQTALVAGHRSDVHRRLGWGLAVIGVAVLVVSIDVTLNFVPRRKALGVDIDAALATFSAIVWSDYAAMLTFAAFLSAGTALRRRAELHKRFLLLASISMMQPPFTRILRWPLFEGLNYQAWGLVALFLLLVAVALFDIVSRRRVHPLTLWGGAFLITARVLSVFVIAGSEAGRSLVRGMGG
jgi:hypothetical protein